MLARFITADDPGSAVAIQPKQRDIRWIRWHAESPGRLAGGSGLPRSRHSQLRRGDVPRYGVRTCALAPARQRSSTASPVTPSSWTIRAAAISGAVVLPAAVAGRGARERPVSLVRNSCSPSMLGYDVARRVLEACGGYGPHNEAGWHSTATCGTFGQLQPPYADPPPRCGDGVPDALGHAASFSGGLWAFHPQQGSDQTNSCRPRGGGRFICGLIARAGVSGPSAVFEDDGVVSLTTFAPHSAQPRKRLTTGLGESGGSNAYP